MKKKEINFSDFVEKDEMGHYLCFVSYEEIIRKIITFLDIDWWKYLEWNRKELLPEERLLRAVRGKRIDFVEYLQDKYGGGENLDNKAKPSSER